MHNIIIILINCYPDIIILIFLNNSYPNMSRYVSFIIKVGQKDEGQCCQLGSFRMREILIFNIFNA